MESEYPLSEEDQNTDCDSDSDDHDQENQDDYMEMIEDNLHMMTADMISNMDPFRFVI